MANREFDVIVWGATGFTGELVVEYLLQTYGVAGGMTTSQFVCVFLWRHIEDRKTPGFIMSV